MEQPFHPQTLSIHKLFADSDSLYQIPQYQRPYKWEDEHVEKLWDDIKDAYVNEESNYFLGSVVTAKADRTDYKDVVDGQQRLTTLMILFCVIRDLYKNHKKEDDSIIVMIESAIFAPGNTDRLKLFTHDSSQTDFRNCVINKGITLSYAKKPTGVQLKKDITKDKFINSAFILREKLNDFMDEFGINEFVKFVNFLFKQVQIIRIDCKDVSFAIKLFQVINDRGMDLTHSDLIKSFLLGEMNESCTDKDVLHHNQQEFNSNWREIEQNSADSNIGMDDLFVMYMYYAIAKNPSKSTYDEFQNQFNKNKEAPLTVVGIIKEFSNNYKNELYLNEYDETINSLSYLRWGYWKSILLSALYVKYPHYDQLVKEIRRYYYVYWIAGKNVTSIKHQSFAIIKMVKEGKSIEEIKDFLRTKEESVVHEAVKNLLSDRMAEKSAWCKPLLLIVEYKYRERITYIELDKNLHLEHILPVGYKRHREWSHIDDTVAEKYLQSAGNITLLSGRKNIAASNKPFAEKINIYKGKGEHDRNENITAFNISRKIIDEHKIGDKVKDWNKNAMRARKKWFLEQVAEILEIPIDTDSI